ncbi:MAG: tail fiber protein [Rhodopila sp.]|nr:tail fiber protein [Rhodopila sp.]
MSEPFLGQIALFPYNFAPRGWADCAGQLLPIRQYTALFSLLGTYYGGDGRMTFALPNLQGTVPVGQGTQPGGSTYIIGETEGSESVTLTTASMPAHSHPLSATTVHGTINSPGGNLLATPQQGNPPLTSKGEIYNTAAPDTSLTQASIQPTGGSLPHNNVQPFLVLRYCIALQGIFPPRS